RLAKLAGVDPESGAVIPGARQSRIQPDGFAVGRHRAGGLALALEYDSAPQMGLVERWVEFQRLLAVGLRALDVTFAQVDGCPVRVKDGPLGLELDRAIVVGQCLTEATDAGVEQSAVVVGIGQFRVEAYRVVEVAKGALGVFLGVMDISAAEESPGVGRIE